MPRQKRILLVEDNRDEVLVFQNYMKDMENYKLVGVADNDENAMQLVVDQKPDIVLLDFSLRGSFGSTLIKNIRNSDISMQPFILVISATLEPWKKKELINMGANEFLVKGNITRTPDLVFTYIDDFFDSYLQETDQKSKMEILVESNTEIKSRLESRIVSDLEYMGIKQSVLAHSYLLHIIQTCVTKKDKRPTLRNYYIPLAAEYDCVESSIERSIAHGIEKAFNEKNYEDTRKIYTSEYGKNTDKPTVREFIFFFIDKYIKEGF